MTRHTKEQIRTNEWKNAIRKRRIAHEVLGWEYYDNLHQYSKNKIHCSCWMCRRKSYDEKSMRDKRTEERMNYSETLQEE